MRAAGASGEVTEVPDLVSHADDRIPASDQILVHGHPRTRRSDVDAERGVHHQNGVGREECCHASDRMAAPQGKREEPAHCLSSRWLDLCGLKRARCLLISKRQCSPASLAARRRVQELWVAAIHSSTRPYSVEVFLMRNLLLGLAVLAATACASVPLAQSKPLPPASSDVMPPVELTITMDGDKPRCAPAERNCPPTRTWNFTS